MRYSPGVNAHLPDLLAAAQPTAWESLRSVSKDTWINLALCLVTLVIVVRLWRTLKKINDFVPYIFAVLAAFLIFFYWVYERREPRFLTPVVDQLAPFFHSKSAQKQIEEKRRRGRDI